MQAEYTYFLLFVLVTAVLLLMLLRMFRAAKGTIRQLNYESRRDRLQHERIAREKHFQRRALRRGTHKINGKPNGVGWNQSDRRATRDFHVDEAAHEVFDPVSDVRGMDVRTPWGWPGSNARNGRTRQRRGQSTSARLGIAISDFFRPKQVVNHEVLAERQRCIRALVEDRYGRVGYGSKNAEIEWSKPELPPELIEEREQDQMLAWKMAQDKTRKSHKAPGIRVVSGNSSRIGQHRRAAGE